MATRLVSKGGKPISLKYCSKNSDCNKITSLILSSESLSDDVIWEELPENHYIYLNRDQMKLMIEPL